MLSSFVRFVSSMLKFDTFLLIYYFLKTILAMDEPHYRSSCSQMFYKIGFFNDFAKFTEKNTCTENNVNMKVCFYTFRLKLYFKRDFRTGVSSLFCGVFGNIFLLENLWFTTLTLYLTAEISKYTRFSFPCTIFRGKAKQSQNTEWF